MTGRRILVGVDSSLSSRVALEHAAHRAAGGCLILASIVAFIPDVLARGLADGDEGRLDHAGRLVDRLAGDVEGVETATVVTKGTPATALAELAHEQRADEIVVGARGMGRFAAALGSVSHALVAHADHPVVVVPRAAADHPPSRTDGKASTVVVGFDGSGPSRAALDYAAARASGGGRVVAVHAFHPVSDWLGWPDYQRALDAAQMHGQELLAELEAEGRPGVELVTSMLEGPAARAIVAAADARDADEIVVGSRGFGAVRGVLGSVSHAVLHEAERPVVVIPADAA